MLSNASTSPDSGPAPVNDILLLKEGVFAAVVLQKSCIHTATEHTKTQQREQSSHIPIHSEKSKDLKPNRMTRDTGGRLM